MVKLKFRCGSCNWKFTRNFAPKLCPYCGKSSVAEDASQAADDLLREVDEGF
ncbi:hypothetical protein J4219_02775 [Candidatus Woesearchaeota archaeon]|nr:hypothetical protein [Candidatus Woesearchaeota archaeon]